MIKYWVRMRNNQVIFGPSILPTWWEDDDGNIHSNMAHKKLYELKSLGWYPASIGYNKPYDSKKHILGDLQIIILADKVQMIYKVEDKK